MANPSANVTSQERLRRLLKRRRPDRIVYAPNYWQWFAHQRNHGRLPPETRALPSQLEVIRHLGLDVVQPQRLLRPAARLVRWPCGRKSGTGSRRARRYRVRARPRHQTALSPCGTLTERLRYVWGIDSRAGGVRGGDVADPLAMLEELLRARRWRLSARALCREQARGRIGWPGRGRGALQPA